jgi:hypothetical protein
MRAAEALLLGSAVLRPVSGIVNNGHGGGCALGMIAKSIGVSPRVAYKSYSWFVDKEMALPCGCQAPRNYYNIGAIIAHLFDAHIMNKGYHMEKWTMEKWTMEKLVAWIDEQDPTPREVEVVVEEQKELVLA